MIFKLKNKDKDIAIFRLNSGISFESLSIVSVLVSNPPNFLVSDTSFITWLSNRMSPISRTNVVDLFKLSKINNICDYCLISKAVSLNDTFWVDVDNSKLTWSNISPYTNSFSTMLSNIAWGTFTPSTKINYESPEFSTDGCSKKCWQRINGDIMLLKSNGYFGELEYSSVYSEYFTTQLCEFLGLKSFVRYNICTKKGDLASACNIFTSERYGFIPIGDLFDSSSCGTLDLDLEIFKKMNAGGFIFDVYREMLILDSLIFNIDRHEGNYGFFVDNDNLSIVTIAPIFDYDRALFYNIGLVDMDLQDIADDLRGLKPRTYNGTFVEQGYLCVRGSKDYQQKLLNVYKNFYFVNNKDFPCNQHRVDMMSKIVRQQAGRILNLCKKNNCLLL